ncbi:hypothetical protein BO94DRAFT_499935 [Aspergillus sclerotioniger CBS 115572]|uniref:BZIP domain-containing protein n=1 Tax=Aspergillus sclerotioniger CBS 115572 TaxID=1450535 RepID=A0A317VN35_9EURO|nr:hypothetical protein BO94DRAFT_499935 [Aspergillus sclerotioniger CBS 115572]PWY74497.1 hypothetical protein BO94DRAFT_499935 [Aspergillus sclerotioniger CBS 115572]
MQHLNPNTARPTSLRDATLAERQIQLEKDEWRHIRNAAERRRRQNRLNQRAYRYRQHKRIQPPQNHSSQSEVQRLEKFEMAAYQCYILGQPSPDHLLALTKANICRAFVHNLSLLGLQVDGLCQADVLSPFNHIGPARPGPRPLPVSLRPTVMQCRMPHHPWLDFFPYPRARDNLIRRLNYYDEDEFCLDILGFWNPDAVDNMLMVWGEPTDPGNWEVTEGFIKKWGWVIQGCPDILHHTNKWRLRRGESVIMRYL